MVYKTELGNVVNASDEEVGVRQRMYNLFANSPIPKDEIMENLGLYMNSRSLGRLLFMHHLYKQILDVPGIIIEFGTRWGQNASLFAAMRGLYDTFERRRHIVAFDTFEGLPSMHERDGESELLKQGGLAVTEGYDNYLNEIMTCQEQDNPLGHIKKFDIIRGDGVEQFEAYLERHPETIVALAYFDFDLYEPTKRCLELLRPHLTKGAILGFDELNDDNTPGETRALAEVFGIHNIALKRRRYASRVSYFKYE